MVHRPRTSQLPTSRSPPLAKNRLNTTTRLNEGNLTSDIPKVTDCVCLLPLVCHQLSPNTACCKSQSQNIGLAVATLPRPPFPSAIHLSLPISPTEFSTTSPRPVQLRRLSFPFSPLPRRPDIPIRPFLNCKIRDSRSHRDDSSPISFRIPYTYIRCRLPWVM